MEFFGYSNNDMKYGVDFMSTSDPSYSHWKRSQRMSKRKKRYTKMQSAYANSLYGNISIAGVKTKKRKKFLGIF